MSEVTRILNAVQQGDPKAAGELIPLVYEELRKLAAHKIERGADVPLWTNLFSGGSIAVDRSDNVFVTGSLDNDSAMIAFSNAGVPLWTNRLDGGYKMVVDSSGNVLVLGSAYNGTNYGYRTVKYSSTVSPSRLDFQKLSNDLVLSWTNAGFNLQSAPAVTGTFTNLPSATSPFTNALTGPQQFFRLSRN